MNGVEQVLWSFLLLGIFAELEYQFPVEGL